MGDMDPDLYNLGRFVEAQQNCFRAAISELRRGEKRSHWMWFIFPQVAGLGPSSMAQRYAIRSREEAEHYLAHPVLGRRLRECAEALMGVDARSAEEIMGYPDYLKLQSSMTLFAEVAEEGSVFERVLDKYYGGEKDGRTVEYLGKHPVS